MQPESAAPLDATLAAERVPATVGIPTEVRVAVRNRAAVPIDIVVRPLGGEAIGEETRLGPLDPGATTTVTTALTVPDRYPGQALTAAVELVVHRVGSVETLGRTILPVELVLDDGGQVAARLVRRDVRGRYRARIRLVLENRTPQPVEVRLGGDAPTGEVQVRLPDDPVVLAPGDGTVVEGRVAARVRLWGGVSRYPFGILVSTRRGTQRLPASFSHRPLFARGLITGLGVLVAFGLWASALVVGLDRLAQRDRNQDEETAQVAGGDGGPAGDGSGPDGAGGAGEGDGAAGAEGEEPPVIQVGGVVSGPAAQGVTVRLESVSLSDARRQDAVFTSTVRVAARSQDLTKVVGGTAQRYRAVPIASTRTQVAPVAPQAGALLTSTNEDGLWGFADVRAPGYYLLTFAKAGYQTSKQVIEATEDSQGIDLEVAMEAGDGAISGTVSGGGGALGGAEVTVTDGVVTHTTTTASTGQVGGYAIEGLSTPGTYLVSVTRAGYGREARLVELGPGGTTSGIDLALHPGVGAVTGIITSPEGRQGGVTVRVEGGDIVREATTYTEGEVGRYLLPQLPIPGSYTLYVEGDGWATETRAATLTGDTEVNLELRRTTAQLSGMVTGPDRQGLSSAGVTLESDAGEVFRTVTAGDGFFSMAGITPGSYVAQVERAGYASAEHLVTLRAGDPVTIEVRLEESDPDDIPLTGTITGTITNDTPGPDHPGPDCTDDGVVGAEIEVVLASPDTRVDPASLQTTANCEDGTFAVSGLPPGVHRVRATHANFVDRDVRVRVPVGGTADASMALTPLASLVVQVFSDATGDRLTGAGVAATISPADDPDLVARPDGALVRSRAFASGGYQLTVRAPNHRAVTRGVTLRAGEELDIDVRLPRLGQLTVAVYDFLSGFDVNPAAGQPVTLLDPNGQPARDAAGDLVTPNPRTTGAEGTVRFTGLAGARAEAPGDGQYLLRIPGRGDVPATVTENNPVDDLATVVLTNAQEHFGGRILWKQDLVDAGVPNPRIQARVVVDTQVGPDGVPAPVTRTYEVLGGADGRFGITWADDLPPGNPVPISHLATLTISAPGFESRTLTSQQIDTDQFRADLVARPGSLSGTLTRQETEVNAVPGGATAAVTSRNGATVTVSVDGQGVISANPADVPAGTYEITYSQSGYDPATVVVVVPPGGNGDASATIVKQGDVTVRARSLVAGGVGPLTGADYQIQRLVDGAFVAHGSVGAVAGDSHIFTGLTHGTYRVRATHPDHVRDGGPWEEVVVGIGATPQVDYQLRRLGSIRGTTGRSFANGPSSVLPGARVDLFLVGGATPVATTTSTGNGTFAFPGLDDGNYLLEVTASGHDDRTVAVTLAIGEDRDVGAVILVTQAARLVGEVHDSRSNAPLVGVLVRLTAPDGAERTTSTGSNGTYAIDDLAPQQWQVALSLNGYSPLQTSLNLTGSAGGEFSYAPNLVRIRNAIVGEVIGRYGPVRQVPVNGATVTITLPDGSPVPDLDASVYETDAAGNFTIADLPTGSYRLHATADGFVDPGARIVTVTETGDLSLLGPQAILLDVIPVQVTVTVRSSVDAPGFARPIANRPVALVADGDSTGTDQPSQTTSGDGEATFTGVIPGAYSIVVEPDTTGSRPGATQDLSVPLGSSALTPTVNVAEGGITGTVELDEGEDGTTGVDDVTVSLLDTDGDVVTTTTTDGSGVYRFLVTPAVPWTVVPAAAPSGHTTVPADRDVTPAAGAVTTGQDFLYQADAVDLTLSVSTPASATFTVSGDEVTRAPMTGASVTFTDVLPNWTLTVEITATGHVSEFLTLTLTPGTDWVEPSVALTPVPPDPP